MPEDAIPAMGRDTRCANCGHAWYQLPVVSTAKGSEDKKTPKKSELLSGRGKIVEGLVKRTPLNIEVRGGKLSLRREPIQQNGRLAERKQRILAQRKLIHQLILEAESKQVPHQVLSRFRAYAAALEVDQPTPILLDGPMAILSATLHDDFVIAPLDSGFLSGWRHLVSSHHSLRPHLSLLPMEDKDFEEFELKEFEPDKARVVTDSAIKVLDDGRLQGVVGQDLIDAVVALQNYIEAAISYTKDRASLLRTGMAAIAGILLKITQVVALPASIVTLTGWAVTPQGQEIILRLRPIVDSILSWFRF